ncbi:hypothetical protein [Algiphilus sp.]|uniref:hypothetical protein n=1 Tax=Algiphilus sp. TaxID=1872431 RepID=UPI003B52687E
MNFRVIGTFEDGSEQDITNTNLITFRLDAPQGEAAFVPGNPGRVRAISPTNEGTPVIVTASATSADAEPVSDTLTIVGGIPRIARIFADPDQTGSCSTPAEGSLVAAGQALQLRALVQFVDANGDPIAIPNECVAERDGLSWTATPTNPDGSAAVSPVTGVFSGQNTSTEDNATYSVTAELVPPETENPQNNRSTASANINVAPASVVDDSLQISATPPRIIVGGASVVSATALFDTGDDTPVRLPVVLDALSVTAGESFITIEETPEDSLSIPVRGIAATPAASPATVEGVFSGQIDTANITVLTPEFSTLELVPIGVAAFEEAGVFAGLQEADAAEFRSRISEDALLFGLNSDGQVPTCDPDGETPCPNGALERHQTLPSVSLPYAVVAYKQDDPEQNQGTLLPDLATACDDGRVIPVQVGGSNDIIDVQTMRPTGEPAEGDEAPPMEPITTASGIKVALVEGLTEGTAPVRARLGGAPSDTGAGINCRTNQTGEAVADAEQDVRVGLLDDAGQPKSITKTTFNISKNFTCVGFTNASQLLDGEEIRGRDKLLSALTFETEADGAVSQIVINVNQQPATNFRVNGGPATNDGKACRNDDEPTDPSITITNGLEEERGRLIADGATGLANNCAAAEFNPTVAPPGFEDSPTTRAATVIVLPVDDAILQGESALSGEEVDGLCGELGTLFTLPIGQLAGMQGSGLLNETILLLETILGPILNNEVIEGPVSEALEGALNTLSETVLGTLLGEDALGLLTDPLLGIIGVSGESPAGIALLPTLVEGLGEITDALNEQIAGNTGAEQPPEPTDPGDPFADDGEDEAGDGGSDSPIPLP